MEVKVVTLEFRPVQFRKHTHLRINFKIFRVIPWSILVGIRVRIKYFIEISFQKL